MKKITCYATKNECYKTAKKMTPQGIVVHSTGANNPNLSRYVDAPAEVGANKYSNHWNDFRPSGQQICVHDFVGKDKNGKVLVANILPYDYCCWGCGSGKKGSYNFSPSYIQFEICEDGLTDKAYFDKVFEVAAEHCAELMKQYPSIKIENVVSHKEANGRGYASGHGDPDHWLKKFGKDMGWFRELVKGFLDEKPTVEIPTKPVIKPFSSYKVRVTTSALNIRKEPSTGSAVTGTIKDKGVYTIVAESVGPRASKWGKLKSGAGWVSLEYCRKI